MGFDPWEGDVDTFLHDITQLSCDFNFLLTAPVLQRLDCQYFTSHLSPCQAVDDSDSSPELVLVPFPQIVFHFFYGNRLFVAFSNNFSAYFSNISFKFPNAKLSWILDDLFGSFSLELNKTFSTALLDLKRNQMVNSDLHLLLPCIPRHLDQFKSVQKGAWELQGVRSADEHHLWKIHWDSNIVINKRTVLRRVEDLKQSMLRVSLVTSSYLLDLIKKDDRVVWFGFHEGSNDDTRHSSYVCSSVSSQLSLIVHSSQWNSGELLPQGFGDRLSDWSFANSRRSVETDYVAFGISVSEFDS